MVKENIDLIESISSLYLFYLLRLLSKCLTHHAYFLVGDSINYFLSSNERARGQGFYGEYLKAVIHARLDKRPYP